MTQLTQQITQIYETNNPYKIAKQKGIFVIEQDLGEILGYFTMIKRIKFIFINEALSDNFKRFTCGHELGHALLHGNQATAALISLNRINELKIEREANEFATHLIMDGSHLEYNYQTKKQILNHYGLPKQMDRFI